MFVSNSLVWLYQTDWSVWVKQTGLFVTSLCSDTDQCVCYPCDQCDYKTTWKSLLNSWSRLISLWSMWLPRKATWGHTKSLSINKHNMVQAIYIRVHSAHSFSGRCSRLGPLFYLLKRGGRGAVGIPARLLYTDWSSFPVILVALRVDSGVPKILINKAILTERICILLFKTNSNKFSMSNESSGRLNGDVIPRGRRRWVVGMIQVSPFILIFCEVGCPEWPGDVSFLGTSVDRCLQLPVVLGWFLIPWDKFTMIPSDYEKRYYSLTLSFSHSLSLSRHFFRYIYVTVYFLSPNCQLGLWFKLTSKRLGIFFCNFHLTFIW